MRPLSALDSWIVALVAVFAACPGASGRCWRSIFKTRKLSLQPVVIRRGGCWFCAVGVARIGGVVSFIPPGERRRLTVRQTLAPY